MEGVEEIDELDFDSWAQLSDKEEESKQSSSQFGFTDEYQEIDPSECIQAQSYERNFVV
jgi:hypothetical protein